MRRKVHLTKPEIRDGAPLTAFLEMPLVYSALDSATVLYLHVFVLRFIPIALQQPCWSIAHYRGGIFQRITQAPRIFYFIIQPHQHEGYDKTMPHTNNDVTLYLHRPARLAPSIVDTTRTDPPSFFIVPTAESRNHYYPHYPIQ
jgi:hypothetical protein